MPNLIRAIYDRLLAAGGVGSPGSTGGATAVGYKVLPMQFVNTPNSGGAHLGSAYDGGYEGYLMSVLEQLRGEHPRDGFHAGLRVALLRRRSGTCRAAIDAALVKTYKQLVAANGTANVVVVDQLERLEGGGADDAACSTRSSSARSASSGSRPSTGRTGRPSSR